MRPGVCAPGPPETRWFHDSGDRLLSARGSGRVGRTEAGRSLEDEALRLAVIAAIRHNHTNYDELLMKGFERLDARERVWAQIEEVLQQWSPEITEYTTG